MRKLTASDATPVSNALVNVMRDLTRLVRTETDPATVNALRDAHALCSKAHTQLYNAVCAPVNVD